MKKYVIPVVIVLLCGVGFLVYTLSMSYSKVQFRNDASAHFMDVYTGGEILAEYNGITTRVSNQNTSKIKSAITVSERKALRSEPEFDSEKAITLDFSDGARYVVAEDGSGDDVAFVLYSYEGKNTYLRIEGYNTFSWIKKAISPEGIYVENEVIETQDE